MLSAVCSGAGEAITLSTGEGMGAGASSVGSGRAGAVAVAVAAVLGGGGSAATTGVAVAVGAGSWAPACAPRSGGIEPGTEQGNGEEPGPHTPTLDRHPVRGLLSRGRSFFLRRLELRVDHRVSDRMRNVTIGHRVPASIAVLKLRTERSGELLEEAAERGRISMRQRFERLRLAWRSIVQIAVAATGAWLFAEEVLGHPRPIFAPISAVVVLGLSVGRRIERAVEISLGVAVGLGIADLIVRVTGVGAWQIALILLLSTSIAVLLGSGQLFASQAAISAVLVATLPQATSPSFGRFFDSLAGGIIAIAVSALVLPADAAPPLRGARSRRCWRSSPPRWRTSRPRSRRATAARRGRARARARDR